MTNDLLPTQDLPKRLSRRNIKIDAGLLPHNMNDPNLLQQEELRLSNLHEHRFFQEKQRVIIIGGFPDGEKIAEKLALEPGLYDVIGIFDDRINRLQNIHHAVPILGNINDMIAFCRHELPDMIIIAIFDASRERLRTIIRKTIVLPANIYLAMDVKSIIKNYTKILSEEETDITLLSLRKTPLHGIKYFQKLTCPPKM